MTKQELDAERKRLAGMYECDRQYPERESDEDGYKYRDFQAGFAAAVKLMEERRVKVLREAVKFYANYDKESVRHMDTEFLDPERIAVIKPMNAIGKGYAPDGMHPSQIYQDELYTYGPKQRPGKIARQALAQVPELV